MIVEIEEDTSDEKEMLNDEESTNLEGRIEEGEEEKNNNQQRPNIITPATARYRPTLRRELQKLQASYNEDATRLMDQAEEEESITSENETGRETTMDNANYIYNTLTRNFAFMVKSVLKERPEPIQEKPERKYGKQDITFQEAWNHPDPIIREKWREAIKKEFHCMNKRKV